MPGAAALVFTLALIVLMAGMPTVTSGAVPRSITPPLAQAAPPSSGCIVSPNDMLAWWPGQGDLSGAVGPTLSGTVGYAPAVVGDGFVFNGNGPLTTTLLPTVTTAVSVEAWIKPQATGVVQAILGRWTWPGGGTEDSYLLMLSPTGGLWWATDDPSTLYPVPAEGTFPQLFDGQHHHIAATWNTTTTALYLDGNPVATTTSVGSSINPDPTTTFGLGGTPDTGMPYTGTIDEPTIYNRTLTPAEIAAIHDAGPAGKCPQWTQQAQLAPTNGAAGDAFGTVVAVDGDTMLVGSYSESQQRGRVRVLVRSGTTWNQQAVLTAGDSQIGDLFGWSVDLSGDVAVVGAIGTAGGDPGAAYVFTRTGTTWTQQAILTAADGAPADEFGDSVAVSGDTVVVGAAYHDGAANNAGAAYVFTRSGAAWSQQAKLVAPSGAVDDLFGYSVGLDADTAVVGAFARDVGTVENAGAAFVFTRTAGTWTLQQQLVALDPSDWDLLGYSVDISGDTIAAGAYLDDTKGDAAGSAHVFIRSAGVWTRQAELVALDGSPADFFGWSVAVDGDLAVVGAMNDDAAALYGGSAYTFTRTGTTWLAPAKLVGSDTASEDSFGYSVAIDGRTAAVGAPGADRAAAGSGSVYVFVS